MKVKKSDNRSASVEEVDDVITEVAVEEDTRGAELVPFALTVDISPPPKVGRFDLLKDMGVSVLKKGVHKLPRTVAEVLQDKGYGSML